MTDTAEACMSPSQLDKLKAQTSILKQILKNPGTSVLKLLQLSKNIMFNNVRDFFDEVCLNCFNLLYYIPIKYLSDDRLDQRPLSDSAREWE